MRLKPAVVAGLALVLAALATAADAYPQFTNGSFEDHFEGWVADPLVDWHYEASHLDMNGQPDSCPGGVAPPACPYTPVDGIFMAVLQAGEADTAVLLSQTFSTQGGRFSGSVAFLGEDFLDHNDSGFVHLYRLPSDAFGPDPQVLFLADIQSTMRDFGYTPWTTFSVPLVAGDYRVEIGVKNAEDHLEPSVLLADNFSLAVPEPATWALMLTGFLALGAVLRRRGAAPV